MGGSLSKTHHESLMRHRNSVDQKHREKKKLFHSCSADSTPRTQRHQLRSTPWVSLAELTRRVRRRLDCHSAKGRIVNTDSSNNCGIPLSPSALMNHQSHLECNSEPTNFAKSMTDVNDSKSKSTCTTTSGYYSVTREKPDVSFTKEYPVGSTSLTSSSHATRPSLSLSAVLAAPLQLVRSSSSTDGGTKSSYWKSTASVVSSENSSTNLFNHCTTSSKCTENVIRPSFNRPHSYSTPYSRFRTASPDLSTEPNAITTASKPFDTANLCSPAVVDPSECLDNVDTQPGQTPSPNISLPSLTSEDLIMDGSLYSPVSLTDRDSSYDSRWRKDKPTIFRESINLGGLEAVTELSQDDLTQPDKEQTTSTGESGKTHHPLWERRTVKSQVDSHPRDDLSCTCSSSVTCDGKTCDVCQNSVQRRRRVMPSTFGSFGRFSLRRLRSRPHSVSFPQPNDDLDAITHLGERSFLLLSSDQRQMVQELQTVKTTLLRLRRLLTEDQWHMPLFSEQLSPKGTAQTNTSGSGGSVLSRRSQARSRPSLPSDWWEHDPTFYRSSTVGHSESICEPEISRGGKDNLVSTAAAKNTEVRSISSGTEDVDAISSLVENLSQLEAENRKLNTN